MKRYFITGTDTDCGKTYVTARLMNYFCSAVAIKPIASGCLEVENQIISSDAQQLQLNSPLSLDVINPWRFKLAVSPHIAAQREGIHLSATQIADYCLNFQWDGVKKLFIEGAGGLMVPLNESETWIDFLQISKIPVVFVVGVKLGCINHALLTEAVLQSNNIKCVGWIANCIDPNMQELIANLSTLTHKLASPLLAKVPFGGEITELSSWPI
ncbi:MAG: dethiobiotin synthase [Legionella longbeachae]|nr:dethiobiotin synthase [Legionella longbeachae]